MKKLLLVTILLLSVCFTPHQAHAAIARDTTTKASFTAAVGTWSWTHTTSAGSNRELVVWLGTNSGLNFSNSIECTYNGVSMTGNDGTTLDNGGVAIFTLANPSTGANTVECKFGFPGGTGASPIGGTGVSASYTGVAQTGNPEATISGRNLGSVNNLTLTLTTVANNSWLVGGFLQQGSGTISAGSNTTFQQTGAAGSVPDVSIGYGDTNAAQTPAGSYSMAASWNRSDEVGGAVVSLAPVAAPVASFFHYLFSLF